MKTQKFIHILNTISSRSNSISRFESTQWKRFWKWLELTALVIGAAGSVTACLANYNWHWFRESMFFMVWSAAPFALFLLAGEVARRRVQSPVLYPITAFLSIAMTSQSLIAYIGAVLHPNHSSGMVFAVLPLLWMIVITALFAVMGVGSFLLNALQK